MGITREKFIEIKAGQSTNSLTNKRNKSSWTLEYRQNSTDITTGSTKTQQKLANYKLRPTLARTKLYLQ